MPTRRRVAVLSSQIRMRQVASSRFVQYTRAVRLDLADDHLELVALFVGRRHRVAALPRRGIWRGGAEHIKGRGRSNQPRDDTPPTLGRVGVGPAHVKSTTTCTS